MKYEISYSEEFEEWYQDQSTKSQIQIDDRLDNIQIDGYFGFIARIDKNIFELKWKNGRRIYYTVIESKEVLLLIGGNKNGQSQDINKAKNGLRKHSNS